MRYMILAMLGGCYTELQLIPEECQRVGQYMLCDNYHTNEEAWEWCSDNEMVLVDFFMPGEDHLVWSDKYKEVYLLGTAEFDREPFWVASSDLSYECTLMWFNDWVPAECEEEHPFICEIY